MKKLLSIIILCLLGLCSCSNNTSVTTTPVATTPVTTTPAETTPIVTTPIVTTPVVTTPASTTPAETTPVISAKYQSPNEAPLTDAEKTNIEKAWYSAKGYTFKWYDEEKVETRHFGWRYYGRINGAILLANADGSYPGYNGGYSVLAMKLYTYEQGQFTQITALLSYSAYDAIKEWHNAFESALLQREDLDDPFWYGGQNLPALGTSPCTEEQLKGTFCQPEDYLGTYNGCSVFYTEGNVRATWQSMFGGVMFWEGEYYSFVAYKDGEHYYLGDAFNRGLLTYEDLRAVAYYLYGENFPEDIYDYVPATTIPAETPIAIDHTPLTGDQIAEIEAAKNIVWYDENDILTRHYGVRYYGTVEEGILLYFPNIKQCNINCEKCFTDYRAHVISDNCCIYRNGDFIALSESSNSSSLIASVRDYHLSFEAALAEREDYDDPYRYDYPEPPANPTVPNEYADLYKKGLYCGTYNGYNVALYESDFAFTNPGLFIIGGVAIYVPNGMFFYVWNEEQGFFSLEDAYAADILTSEDIRSIAYYCYGESMPDAYRKGGKFVPITRE